MNAFRWTALLTALAFASAAPAQDETRAEASGESREVKQVDIEGAAPPAEETCFNVRDIRSFDALDDRHIYARGRADNHYLFTMLGVCPGLEGAFRIAISDTFSRVCSLSSATVTYRGFTRLETCRIGTVEAVEDKAAAEALVESRERR
jgi:hypothetical protein